MDLLCVGEVLIDFTPGSTPDEFTANPGGAPANVAVMAARSGCSVGFLGKLGNDDFGKRLVSVLEAEQIKVLCPKLTDEAITTLAFVHIGSEGERSFTFARKPGADILLSEEDVKTEDIEDCRMLHAGSFSLSDEPSRSAVKKAMRLARKTERIVSFDINYRDMIWPDEDACRKQVDEVMPFCDLVKISEEELGFIGIEDKIEEYMIKNRITLLVETLAEKGARYYFRRSGGSVMSDTIPGRKAYAIDTTAAGDAFWGGFLAKLLSYGIKSPSEITEDMIRSAVMYGNVAGSLCVQSWGGIPALPEKKRIDEAVSQLAASVSEALEKA